MHKPVVPGVRNSDKMFCQMLASSVQAEEFSEMLQANNLKLGDSAGDVAEAA